MKKKFSLLLLFLILIVCVSSVGYVKYHSNENNNAAKIEKIKNKNLKIVALGDSLTQGVGDPTNKGGYVSRIKNKLKDNGFKKITTYNYGIAGQRSDQINKRINNNTNNLSSQLEKANLITLTVGGNDLLQDLQKNALVDSHDTFEKNMDREVQNYKDNLSILLKNIRKYNNRAPVYIFGIYNPIYVYFANVSVINEYVGQINDITQNQIANNYKMHFVDINFLSYGQYNTKEKQRKLKNMNQDTSPFDVNKLSNANGEINDYISPKDHFHPNNLGYNYMANQLFSKINKFNDWG